MFGICLKCEEAGVNFVARQPVEKSAQLLRTMGLGLPINGFHQVVYVSKRLLLSYLLQFIIYPFKVLPSQILFESSVRTLLEFSNFCNLSNITIILFPESEDSRTSYNSDPALRPQACSTTKINRTVQ